MRLKNDAVYCSGASIAFISSFPTLIHGFWHGESSAEELKTRATASWKSHQLEHLISDMYWDAI